MSAEGLHHLADVEEIRIGFRRPDGSTRSVPIWVVRAGDDIYVRSVRGPGASPFVRPLLGGRSVEATLRLDPA